MCGFIVAPKTTAFQMVPSKLMANPRIRFEARTGRFCRTQGLIFNGVKEDGNIEVEDADDDDDSVTPYGSQTLAWTKRYRKLVPYEAARMTAMRLGLRSKEEWDDIREFGKAFHGAHLVSRPDELYRKEWISWDEFLGVMRPYDEAKQMVQEQFKLRSMEEYVAFVKKDIKRAESLRIPAKPEIYYRDKGWISEEDFFN